MKTPLIKRLNDCELDARLGSGVWIAVINIHSSVEVFTLSSAHAFSSRIYCVCFVLFVLYLSFYILKKKHILYSQVPTLRASGEQIQTPVPTRAVPP